MKQSLLIRIIRNCAIATGVGALVVASVFAQGTQPRTAEVSSAGNTAAKKPGVAPVGIAVPKVQFVQTGNLANSAEILRTSLTR